jgi:hypothetical protein
LSLTSAWTFSKSPSRAASCKACNVFMGSPIGWMLKALLGLDTVYSWPPLWLSNCVTSLL